VVDVSGASVGAVAHLNRGVFPFSMIWSLYMATFGQATPSAFWHYRTAETLSLQPIVQDNRLSIAHCAQGLASDTREPSETTEKVQIQPK